jgi:hypothetical protein
MVAVPFTAIDVGGGVLRVTAMVVAAVMVMAALLALFEGSATEVAVMTTVLDGTVAGAV